MALVERDEELDAVIGLLASASRRNGATLLVEGPPGIGKTVLLAAVRDLAERRGFCALSAVGGELDQELPFAVVRQLLEPPLATAPPARRADLLAGAASLAAPVFALDEVAAIGAGAPAVGNVVHGLYWLCSNLSESAPLMLVVDDVHWADEASLRFLSHLARRIADLPALLVVAGRPGRTLDDLLGRVLSGVRPEVIRLRPFSEVAVRRLVRDSLGADADNEFCHACAGATGGNPFLLGEALMSLRADGVRPVAAESPRVENLLPDTISRAVLTRVARLGAEAVQIARAVALLGPSADLRQVAGLAELPTHMAATVVDALAREAVLSPGRPIEFVHPLVRTAVYRDSSEALRAADHKRAAIVLNADGVMREQLVPHLLAAEPDGDTWVVDTLRAAATSALGRGAPESAVACLARAVAEPPAAGDRGAVYSLLGRALAMVDRPAEAAVALREALERAVGPQERFDLALELGFLLQLSGQVDDAVRMTRLAQTSIESVGPEIPTGLAACLAMADFITMQPPVDWIGRLDRLVSESPGSTDRQILALLSFGASVTGDRSAGEVARLAGLAASGPLPRRDTWVLVNLASAALTIADEMSAAFDLLDRGLDEARRLGDETTYRYLMVLRSHTALFAGRLDEAEGDARVALEGPVGSRPRANPLAAAVLVDALAERGALTDAQQVLANQGLEGPQSFDLLIAHFVLLARGRLRRRQGRSRDAIADLRKCGRTLVAAGYTNPAFAPWRAEAALAHLAVGEIDVATALAAENLELARAFQAPREIAMALRVWGLIEGGAGGVSVLAEAVATLDGSQAHLERASCLVEHGAALRRSGERVHARVPLREGLDLAVRCGATSLAERAREELRASGARPRGVMLSGRDALTISELRVARLAAEGATNREIAQSLFVSRRTVEIHLTSSYRKLAIGSRQELRTALT